MKSFFLLATLSSTVNAYWLMSVGTLTPEPQRVDPILSPGAVSSHSHYGELGFCGVITPGVGVLGGSNFRPNTNTASLRSSECTTTPIAEDKSSYWYPNLYFQWANGSFSSLTGGNVMCVISLCFYFYLLIVSAKNVTAFPDDFRMITGTPMLRTYDSSSYAQQAVTFLCLDFTGTTTKFNSIPPQACASGVRAQINFPSCWDGVNTDSADHKSHVAFLSGGPDSGTCQDPKFPVRLPRIFLEVYWATGDFENYRNQAKNPTQPFVFSFGDPTGYGYHADFINGWDDGALQKAVDNCHCDEYGSPTCCAAQGIFTYQEGKQCHITDIVDEKTSGLLSKLPGNNPVQQAGIRATVYTDDNVPGFLEPVYVYTGSSPTATATATQGGSTAAGSTVSSVASSASSTFTSAGNINAVIPTAASSSSTESSPSSTEVTSASAEVSSSTKLASPSTELSSSNVPASTSVASPVASLSSSSTSAGGHAHHTHSHAAAPSSSSSSDSCKRESRRDDIDHSSRFRRTHRRHMDYDAYTF
ncbi:WSC domain-containing protein [Desarmillaria ectypa]|nr:WSC domain-containing protein [Desarmillaria ectypa]